MKKYFVFFAVFVATVCFMVLPCAAAETTAAPSEPVDWFGSSETYYSYTGTGAQNLPTSANPLTAPIDFTLFQYAQIHAGDVYYVTRTSGDSGCDLYINGSLSNVRPNWYNGTYTWYGDLSSYTSGIGTINGSAITVGVDGFVDSGVSDALSELGIIVQAILTNQYILIAIGLAVAVPLVGWGISKLKSLVKGY